VSVTTKALADGFWVRERGRGPDHEVGRWFTDAPLGIVRKALTYGYPVMRTAQ